MGELLQGELGDLALVGRLQVEELAPGVGQAAHLGNAVGDQGVVASALCCTTYRWLCCGPRYVAIAAVPAGAYSSRLTQLKNRR